MTWLRTPEPTLEDRVNSAAASAAWATHQFAEIVLELDTANLETERLIAELNAEIDRLIKLRSGLVVQRAANIKVADRVAELVAA